MAVIWPLNSRKRFVYSSPIPENLSAVQGVYVWSSAKIIHIPIKCCLELCREIYSVCGKKG